MAARSTSSEDEHTTRLSAFASEEERDDWPDPVDPDAWATPPWDDRDELDRLYNRKGLSTARIATDVFRGRLSAEAVRKRLHKFDIMPASHEREVGKGDPLRYVRKLESEAKKRASDQSEKNGGYGKYTLAGREADNE